MPKVVGVWHEKCVKRHGVFFRKANGINILAVGNGQGPWNVVDFRLFDVVNILFDHLKMDDFNTWY